MKLLQREVLLERWLYPLDILMALSEAIAHLTR